MNIHHFVHYIIVCVNFLVSTIRHFKRKCSLLLIIHIRNRHKRGRKSITQFTVITSLLCMSFTIKMSILVNGKLCNWSNYVFYVLRQDLTFLPGLKFYIHLKWFERCCKTLELSSIGGVFIWLNDRWLKCRWHFRRLFFLSVVIDHKFVFWNNRTQY